MTRIPRRLAAASLAVALIFGAAACGSSDSGSDGAADDTEANAPDDTTAADAGTDDTTDGSDEGTDSSGEAGTGTVTLTDGEAGADLTVTYTEADGFAPGELTVGVGELFTFVSGDDGVHAVKFGESSDTFTITNGLIESFTIDAAGTYTVTEDISGATMTITVE